MSESLKESAKRGIIWSAIERFSVQGVQFVIMIIMARLLTPKDYGIIGMLSIFISVAQSLIDSGFSNALIRKQNRTEIDNSTVFYFNIVIAIGIYVVLFLTAPFVADFYNMPQLVSIMRVICLGIIFSSFSVVQRAILTINIDFKTQAKASLFAISISGIIGVFLAYHGCGPWSLVFQQILNLGINSLILWILSKWKPLWAFSWKSFKELFSFGSKLLCSGLLDTIYNNIYPLIIGKVFKASDLGHYSRAYQFASFPTNITSVMQRVTYPMLCKLQNDDERLARVYRKFLKISAFIIFPLMCGLAGVSEPLIRLVIGDKWLFCSKLLTILCFSLMWYPIHAINLNLLQVKGRSDLFFKLEIYKKILGIIILIVTIHFNLTVMCYGAIIQSLLSLLINTYYTGKLIKVGFFIQMKDILPSFLLSTFMFVAVYLSQKYFVNLELKLFIGIITGCLIYIIGSYVFKFREVQEIKQLVNRK